MQQLALLSKVSENLASLPLLLPEGLLAITLGAVLLLTAWLPRHQRYWLRPVAFLGLSLAGGSKYGLESQLVGQAARPLFSQLLVLDPLAIFFGLLL